MTRRGYELIAEVFRIHRKMYGNRTDSVVKELIDDLAQALSEDNKAFDRELFLKNCGIAE